MSLSLFNIHILGIIISEYIQVLRRRYNLNAVSGEQFMVGPEICGARLSVRYNEGLLSLWNKNAQDQKTCYRLVMMSLDREQGSEAL